MSVNDFSHYVIFKGSYWIISWAKLSYPVLLQHLEFYYLSCWHKVCCRY